MNNVQILGLLVVLNVFLLVLVIKNLNKINSLINKAIEEIFYTDKQYFEYLKRSDLTETKKDVYNDDPKNIEEFHNKRLKKLDELFKEIEENNKILEKELKIEKVVKESTYQDGKELSETDKKVLKDFLKKNDVNII